MKRVLSIDFDVILGSNLMFYNHLVPKFSWEQLKDYPQMMTNKIDANYYQYLTKLLMQIAPCIDPKNIVFAENHAKILDILPLHEEIELINIDHHHDLGYLSEEQNGNFSTINCSNWVQAFAQKGQLKHYTWISNNYYENYNLKDYKYKINMDHIVLQPDKELSIQSPDILFICLSEPWTPPEVRPLFFTWMDLYNNYFNTHFTMYWGEYEIK